MMDKIKKSDDEEDENLMLSKHDYVYCDEQLTYGDMRHEEYTNEFRI